MLVADGYSVVEGDLMEIYIPTIKNMYRDLLRGESIWFSWNIGLGSNTALMYDMYAMSLFNALYLLDSILSDGLITVVSVAIRTGLAAVAFAYYTKKSHEASDRVVYLLAVLYALCSYQVAYNCTNIMWLDALWILPLVFNGISSLVREDKICGLLFSYTYIFATNFYMGYMIGLASGIYFAFYVLYHRDETEKWLRKSLCFMASAIGAAGISAALWLPALMQVLSKQAVETTGTEALLVNVLDVYNQLFLGEVGTLYSTGPNIYCGLLVVVLLPLYFYTGKKIKREYVGLLVVLGLACVLKPLYMLMHAFDVPNGWDYRFSYIISFVLCVIAVDTLDAVRNVSGRKLGIIVLANAAIYYIIMVWQRERQVLFGSNTEEHFVVNLILIAIYAVLIYMLSRKNARENILGALVAVSLVECLYAGYLYHYKREEVMPEMPYVLYDNWSNSMSRLGDELGQQNQINRVDYHNELIANGGMQCGYQGISYFCSDENRTLRGTLSKLGLWTTPRSVRGYGLTDATRMVLGVGYEAYGPNYQKLASGDLETELYKNDYDLGLAYVVDDDIRVCSLKGDNAFENINELLSSMTGEDICAYRPMNEDQIYVRTDGMDVELREDGIVFSLIPENNTGNVPYADIWTPQFGEPIYAYAVNEESLHTSASMSIYGGEENEFYQNGLLSVSYIKELAQDEEGSHLVIIGNGALQGQRIEKMVFAFEDNDEVEKAYELLETGRLRIDEIDNQHIRGMVQCNSGGEVFFAVPYAKGWQAYVDSNPCEIDELVDGTFIGVHIEEAGEHIVVLKYRAPGATAGLVVSVTSLLVMVAAFVFKKNKSRLREF